MVYDLEEIKLEALEAFGKINDPEALEALRIKYLGSKGLLKEVLAAIKDIPREEKKAYGQQANQLKKEIQAAFESAQGQFAQKSQGVSFDVTKPGKDFELGHEHPIAAAIREIVSLFQSLGFKPLSGPEVEDEFHNFDALNIPSGHPARDQEDNFFLQRQGESDDPTPTPFLLRSQTSTIQVRAVEEFGVPLRVVAPGRVYRPDTVDATHHYMFHQIEGLAIDEGLTFQDLRGVLELFVKEYFGSSARYRLRPHYFPFTEVSAEVDIACDDFKHLKKDWLEILGCGMVDPNVLKALDIDPERYTGFAWGMGVERIIMLRYGIPDIRVFLENDLRFLQQF